MAIIKQDIKHGFDSKKVTFGDPNIISNRTSERDKNVQTKPLRPK
ncbi:hypothetical protein [Sporomusa malonica]|uniref:Uncharacterized protein n=1 Tax=Sporomusa malonica TaxID=112901 RepID=A0A1W2DTN5_9FIRM|nr:hypothetical protein [Sporomusa malonica]SMD00905.1 hypothetical protein SAMN04488500_11853 [Sporomusa malonica]